MEAYTKQTSQTIFPREFSPLLILTAGLEPLHARIRATHVAGHYSSNGDQLTLGHGMPLLAKRFRFLHKIGEGTFSQLICAEDTLRIGPLRQVAIKIMHRPFLKIGSRESKLLHEIRSRESEHDSWFVRVLSTFTFFGHYCLVFELLNGAPIVIPRPPSLTLKMQTIYDKALKKVAHQLICALLVLGQQQMIHADLKPENVLLVQQSDVVHTSFAIKVIDFGNAMYEHEASHYFEDFQVQSLLYRAPEVLLGIPFGLEIDMWSVGCIIAEVFMERPLFQAHTREQMIDCVTSLLGPLPPDPFSKALFWRSSYADLKTLSSSHQRDKLSAVTSIRDPMLLSFLQGLLELDPRKRLTPFQALLHPYLVSLMPIAPYLVDAAQTHFKTLKRSLSSSNQDDLIKPVEVKTEQHSSPSSRVLEDVKVEPTSHNTNALATDVKHEDEDDDIVLLL